MTALDVAGIAAVLVPVMKSWGVRSRHGEWSDEEAQQSAARDAAKAVAAHVEALREADRAAMERAWSDGYNDAATMARHYGHTDHWENEPDNPYAARTEPTQ